MTLWQPGQVIRDPHLSPSVKLKCLTGLVIVNLSTKLKRYDQNAYLVPGWRPRTCD